LQLTSFLAIAFRNVYHWIQCSLDHSMSSRTYFFLMCLPYLLIVGLQHISLIPGLALVSGIPFCVGLSKNFLPDLITVCSSIKSLKVIYDLGWIQGCSSISDFYEYWGFISKSGILSGSQVAGSVVHSNQFEYLGLEGVSPTLSELGGLLWTFLQWVAMLHLFISSAHMAQKCI
jgi:hypothetical protein